MRFSAKCLDIALESEELMTAVLMQLWMCGSVVISATVAGAVKGPRLGVYLGAKQGQNMYLVKYILDVPIVICIYIRLIIIMNEDY